LAPPYIGLTLVSKKKEKKKALEIGNEINMKQIANIV
jgi:hypothetical protein